MVEGAAPVIPVDLSGPDGLRGCSQRMGQLLGMPSQFSYWGVLVLGLDDAVYTPGVRQWLDGAEACARVLADRCARTLLVTPPPILMGRAVRRFGSNEVKRWARKTPQLLAERCSGIVSGVVSLADLPEALKADDVWPTAPGYDWIADKVAGALLRAE